MGKGKPRWSSTALVVITPTGREVQMSPSVAASMMRTYPTTWGTARIVARIVTLADGTVRRTSL